MKNFAPVALALALATSGVAQFRDRIDVRADDVVPVKFESAISVKNTRRGDRISARVDNNRILPEGTRILGRVTDIRAKDGKYKAYAEMEFTEIELPNGERIRIDAYPVPLGDKYVQRDRNGRLEAKKGTRRDHVVIGSTVGGILIGSILKKPMEGAIIGVLGGILAAETDALNTNGELIVEKGQRYGAAFDRDVSFDWTDRDSRYDRDRRTDPVRGDDQGRDDRFSANIQIEFENRALSFREDRMPYRDGNVVMVPISETAAQLGLECNSSSGRAYYLEDEENSLKLEQNGEFGRLNGKRINLPKALVERGGVTYAPIEAFALLKKNSLYVNGSRVIVRS